MAVAFRCWLGVLCVLIFALGSLASASQASVPDGTWEGAAPAPTKRTEVTAAALEGKIYLLGGFSEPRLGNLLTYTVTTAVEVYDPVTDRWMTAAPLPVGLHHAAAAVIGDRLFVVGGFTPTIFSAWHPVATVYEYRQASDRWMERAPMPTARGALAVAVHSGKLYAIGGYGEDSNASAVEVYDPIADAWTAGAPLPTPRDHLAAATVDDRIYGIGGRVNRDYGRNLAITEAYNPVADRWTRVADLPTPRSGITAAVLHGAIFVLGGEAPQGTFQTNEAYWPETDTWHTRPPLPTGRHGLGSAVVNNRLYVLSGGPTPGGSYSNANEVFVPEGKASGPASPIRTPLQQIGTIMALLAAFQDAKVLPPEGSRDADRLIRALIQFQAGFIKSDHPAVQEWLTAALTARFGPNAASEISRFREDGWTSQALEAIVDYADQHAVWERAGV
ncbi:MAG: Kelch repeat-containing protein, partial [Nitrospirales bacterium]